MRKSFAIIIGALTVVFLYVIASFQFVGQVLNSFWKPVLFWLPYLIFVLLSIALVFLTLKKEAEGKLKKFLLLTGISPLVMVASIILHNLVYALFIVFFGENFWERIGLGDEPFFFLLAIVVCPIAFLIGLVGSIVLLIKTKRE